MLFNMIGEFSKNVGLVIKNNYSKKMIKELIEDDYS